MSVLQGVCLCECCSERIMLSEVYCLSGSQWQRPLVASAPQQKTLNSGSAFLSDWWWAALKYVSVATWLSTQLSDYGSDVSTESGLGAIFIETQMFGPICNLVFVVGDIFPLVLKGFSPGAFDEGCLFISTSRKILSYLYVILCTFTLHGIVEICILLAVFSRI